jgi:hypothetical protein
MLGIRVIKNEINLLPKIPEILADSPYLQLMKASLLLRHYPKNAGCFS